MANIQYNIAVEVANAERSIDSLATKVNQLQRQLATGISIGTINTNGIGNNISSAVVQEVNNIKSTLMSIKGSVDYVKKEFIGLAQSTGKSVNDMVKGIGNSMNTMPVALRSSLVSAGKSVDGFNAKLRQTRETVKAINTLGLNKIQWDQASPAFVATSNKITQTKKQLEELKPVIIDVRDRLKFLATEVGVSISSSTSKMSSSLNGYRQNLQKALDKLNDMYNRMISLNKQLASVQERIAKTRTSLGNLQPTVKYTPRSSSSGDSYSGDTSYSKRLLQREIDLRNLRKEMERNFDENFKANNEAYYKRMSELGGKYSKIKQEIKEIERGTKQWGGLMHIVDEATDSVEHRIKWLATRGIAHEMFNIVGHNLNAVKEIEQDMAGFAQVMEHSNHSVNVFAKSLVEVDPSKLGNAIGMNKAEIKAFNEQLGEMQKRILELGVQYGATSHEVIESAKLWGRAYKDNDTVIKLTEAATKLAVADAFDIQTANKALESSIMQWGFHIQNANQAMATSNKIVDSWTALSHNYTVSANTLVEANRRMAQSAKEVGVSFDFAQALISVMARKTMAEGGEIGNALKSIFGSIHSAKSIKALEDFGVQVKRVGTDGVEHFRKVEDVMIDLMIKTATTKNNIEDLLKAISGGKWQWNKASAMLDIQEFMTAYRISIESYGFTNQQIAMQLDTIGKKSQQIQTQIEMMFSQNGGLKTFVKNIMDIGLGILKILDKMPSSVSLLLVGIGGVSIALKLLGTSFKEALSKGIDRAKTKFQELRAEMQKTSNTAKLTANSIRNAGSSMGALTGGLNKALMGMGAIVDFFGGPWVIALTAATLAFEAWTSSLTAELDSLQKEVETEKEMLAVYEEKGKRLEMAGEQMSTLVDAHFKLKEAMGQVQEGTEEYNKLAESEQEVHQALIGLVGDEAAANIEAANDKEEALNRGNQAIDNAKKVNDDATKKMREAYRNSARAVKQMVNDDLQSLSDEQQGWWDTIKVVQKYLTLLDGLELVFTQTRHRLDEKELNRVEGNIKYWDNQAEKYEKMGWKEKAAEARENAKTSREQVGKLKNNFDASQKALEQKVAEVNVAAHNKYKELDQIDESKYGGSGGGGHTQISSPTGGGGGGGGGGSDRGGSSHSTEKEVDIHKIEADRIKKEIDAKLQLIELEDKMREEKFKEESENITRLERLKGETVDTIQSKIGINQREFGEIKEFREKNIDDTMIEIIKKMYVEDKKYMEETLKTKLEDFAFLDSLSKKKIALGIDKENHKEFYEVIQGLIKLTEIEEKLDKRQDSLTDTNAGLDKKQNELAYKNEKESIQLDQQISDAENKYVFEHNVQKYEREKESLQEIVRLEEERLQYMKENDYSEMEISKQYLALVNARNAAKEYAETLHKDVRQGVHDIFHSIVQEGKSIKDIWKDLWSKLADEAINALFRINNGQQSFFSSLFDLFAGKRSGNIDTGAISRGVMSSSRSFFGVARADGGIVDEDSIYRAGEHGKKEMVIPLERHSARSKMLLKETAQHLGVSTPTGVQPVFNNKDVASGRTVQQINMQSSLMNETNSRLGTMINIMSYMANKESNSDGGGATMLQPVIMKQTMSDSEFARTYERLQHRRKI